MTRNITPEDVIRHMEVPGAKGLFVIGCFEKRVTLLSQQVRALNIVYALHQCKRLKKGSKVAVIGGGVAGMTAAAAAARLECDVTLLEKKDALLNILRGNSTRWIHPHVYDWPLEGTERDDAALPLLTWRAAPARDVVTQLESGWSALPEKARISTFFNVDSIHIDMEGNRAARRHISWNISSPHASSNEEDSFDVVLLTVGFGLERKVEGIQWSSYWDNDPLDQPVRSSGNNGERYLISGCGDGGLVDLLRVRLKDFRHEHVLKEFLSAPTLGPLKARLLEIEEQARLEDDEAGSSAIVAREYKALPCLDELDEKIGSRLRGDTVAVLNGLGTRALTLQSCILNRLLVSRLLFRFGVHYRPGRFKTQKQGEFYEVRFETGKPELFNHVVCRHGPYPSVLEEEFQSIWSRCESMMARSVLDQTRWPIWPKGFFEIESEGVGRPASSTAGPSLGSSHEQSAVGAARLQTAIPVQQTSAPRPSSERGSDTVPDSRNNSLFGTAEQAQERKNLEQEPVSAQPEQNKRTPDESSKSKEPLDKAKAPLEPKRAGQSASAVTFVLGLALVWFVFFKDREGANSGDGRIRAPGNVSAPVPGRSGGQPPGEVKQGAPSGSDLVKGISQKIKAGADNLKKSEPSSGGDVAFAGGVIRTPQQLRGVHRVRPLTQGSDVSQLSYLPVGAFGFVEIFDSLPLEQGRVSNLQAANTVEVHRLADGHFQFVGYVWDVESRAIGTGRPVNVQLFFQPFGRSQSIVSIPLERIRSFHVKSEQGQFSVELELVGSSGM